jgi:tetrapyrrole methylase family protein / MazG family protein
MNTLLTRANDIAKTMDRYQLSGTTSNELHKAVIDEMDEFKTIYQNPDKTPKSLLHYMLEDEYGDALYSLLNLGRQFNIDPYKALTRTLNKMELRLKVMKDISDKPLEQLTSQQNRTLWEHAKNLIRSRHPKPNGQLLDLSAMAEAQTKPIQAKQA